MATPSYPTGARTAAPSTAGVTSDVNPTHNPPSNTASLSGPPTTAAAVASSSSAASTSTPNPIPAITTAAATSTIATATPASGSDPFALAEDGSAVDPVAFQAALLADPDRMAALQSFPEYLQVLTGSDMGALQELLRSAVQAEKARLERQAQRWPERSIDAQRASAPVPRDTVQIYKQLAEAGLEYGPAFRLLRNVHVPLPEQ